MELDELLKQIEYMQNYLSAVQSGIDKFMKVLPIVTKQQIKKEAKYRLNSTADHYISKVSVKTDSYVLLVELDRKDWLANALETGVGSFDMKEGHLKSDKAKTSKAGYRYMVIPMSKDKKGTSGTETGQALQDKINAALDRPKYGIKKLKKLSNGKVTENQRVMSDDADVQGLYRTREFPSIEAYYGGRYNPKWQYVMFRIMSENPTAKGKWQHPGIQPANIFRAVDRWLDENIPILLDKTIEAELIKVDFMNKNGV